MSSQLTQDSLQQFASSFVESTRDYVFVRPEDNLLILRPNRIHYLNSTNTQLKEEMKGLKSKLDLLVPGEAECPLCGTELGAEGLERIKANYQAQGQEKGEREHDYPQHGLRD